jgi:hypothetical protein
MSKNDVVLENGNLGYFKGIGYKNTKCMPNTA